MAVFTRASAPVQHSARKSMIRPTALSSFGLFCFMANLHRRRSAFRGGAFPFSERLSRRVHPTKGSSSWPRADNEILRPASRSDRTQATRNDRPILEFGFQRGTRAF